MLYREIIAVCSQIHTKHINTLCGQNVELLNVELAVHMVTTVRYKQLSYKKALQQTVLELNYDVNTAAKLLNSAQARSLQQIKYKAQL